MSELKNEIELFLLENNFSLTDDTASSKTMFVYKSNSFKDFSVFISSDTNEKHVICYLETLDNDFKLVHVNRIVLNQLSEFVFLITHCMRSPLFSSDSLGLS